MTYMGKQWFHPIPHIFVEHIVLSMVVEWVFQHWYSLLILLPSLIQHMDQFIIQSSHVLK